MLLTLEAVFFKHLEVPAYLFRIEILYDTPLTQNYKLTLFSNLIIVESRAGEPLTPWATEILVIHH